MHKVTLLRHGESVWNRENRFTGWTDVDLSDLGRDEARRASSRPRSDRSTSVQPVKRFSRFQTDSPWRSNATLCTIGVIEYEYAGRERFYNTPWRATQ